METEDTEMSIHDIKLWTVDALKAFLRQRNLKVSSHKEELVASVFAAKTMPELLAPGTLAAVADLQKRQHCGYLLKTPFGKLPDPQELQDWESESDSITKWPPTMTFEICNFLQSIDDIPLWKRLISDYKDQKAYSYFASGWMNEIEYHAIAPDSKYCFLRAKCTPSQRIRGIPHSMWDAVEKESGADYAEICDE
ncbi:uncharacterized protein [Diadema antillarum]|uniref:uncharacterized protein n=1 Tax=Diadema antillarum TaxID=105358 RepID=UPI003A86C9EA